MEKVWDWLAKPVGRYWLRAHFVLAAGCCAFIAGFTVLDLLADR